MNLLNANTYVIYCPRGHIFALDEPHPGSFVVHKVCGCALCGQSREGCSHAYLLRPSPPPTHPDPSNQVRLSRTVARHLMARRIVPAFGMRMHEGNKDRCKIPWHTFGSIY